MWILRKIFLLCRHHSGLAGKIVTSISEADPPDALETPLRATTLLWMQQGRDFGKPAKFKIQTPPFHAAWATPVIHDTRSG